VTDDQKPKHIAIEAALNMRPGGLLKLYRPGLSFVVWQLVFAGEEPQTLSELTGQIVGEIAQANELFESSQRVADLNPSENPDAAATLMANDDWPEKWALAVIKYGSELVDEASQLDDGARQVLLWRLAKARTMLIFTRHLEQLTWRGYQNFGAETLAEGLTAWEVSDKTEAEEYWQTFIQDRPYLINLIAPGPVVVHTGKAFLGGKKVDNTGGKIVDFLLANSIGGNAALLEIKRPATKLLRETPYRDDIYAPSTELAGSVAQVLNYRDTLMTEKPRDLNLNAFMPSCMVLIGNHGSELDSPEKRRSFELYRSSLNGVSIVTYDELFDRLKKILDVLRGD
jgi:hypothetical protein